MVSLHNGAFGFIDLPLVRFTVLLLSRAYIYFTSWQLAETGKYTR